ncbi:MAG: DUF4097 family beta strand repeat protein [Clostridia bacterium]|nr:DUF4097 family beta strand repeat protein [Clostridia bacterium]
MSKKIFAKAVSIVCAALLLAVLAWGVAGVLSPGVSALAEKYEAGEAEISGTVRNLDIDWISGKVHIIYHSGNGIRLRESAARAIPKDQQMIWRLDGDTLRIQYEKAGFHLFRFTSLQKELTLELPEGISLNNVSISVTSGEMDIPSLWTDSLRLEATSGDIRAAAAAKDVTIETTSGDVMFGLSGNAQALSIHSTSGNVLLRADSVDKAVFDSTSGSIQAELQSSKKVTANSTSGDLSVTLSAMDTLKIDTTSGNVSLFLHEAPGFTARFDTVSGSIQYELPLLKRGADYVCGDGSGTLQVSTTSGNIRVNASDR